MNDHLVPSVDLEFDALMARSGLHVPPQWRAGTLAGYASLRQATALLRQTRPAESEPAAAFDLRSVLRTF